MSTIKRQSNDQEARYKLGLDLCIQANMIQECEDLPGTYFEGDEQLETAYLMLLHERRHSYTPSL